MKPKSCGMLNYLTNKSNCMFFFSLTPYEILLFLWHSVVDILPQLLRVPSLCFVLQDGASLLLRYKFTLALVSVWNVKMVNVKQKPIV